MVSAITPNISVGSSAATSVNNPATAANQSPTNTGTAAAQNAPRIISQSSKENEGALKLSENRSTDPRSEKLEGTMAKRKSKDAISSKSGNSNLDVVA